MSQQNIEIVRQAMDAFNRGDLERSVEPLAPNVAWHDQRELPGARVHHGPESVLAHLRSVTDDMPDYHFELEAVRDVGDRVMVSAVVSARGRTSGAAVKRETFTVYTFDGEQITRVEIFGSEDEALEAAGLQQ
jgi:ketosteroid isomerase-like protein